MKEIYKIGGYVRCIKSYDCAKIGDILEITDYGGKNSHPNSVHVKNEEGQTTLLDTTFASFPECEWVGMEKPQEVKNSLAQEAIRRYPKGTKFYPAHINKEVIFTSTGIVKEEETYRISMKIEEEESWVPNVYYNGGWAEIFEEPKTEKWQPKTGEYAYVEKTGICNISGKNFSVGDVFEITRTEISSNERYDYLWLHTKKGTICKASCRCALPHEIPQQKTETMKTYTPQVGDWVVSLATTTSHNKGDVYQLVKIEGNKFYSEKVLNAGGWLYRDKIRKARPDEIPHTGDKKTPPIKEESMESLVREANRRFPQGTIVKTLVGSNGVSKEETIGNEALSDYSSDSISSPDMKGYVYWKGEWATKIEKTPEITKEEVLRRYPKGTKYKGLRDGNIQTSEGEITHFGGDSAAVGYDYVYRNGRWADVISTPVFDTEKIEKRIEKLDVEGDLLEEAKRRFPIGTKFGNLHDNIGDECIVIGGHYVSGKDICVKADRPFEKVKNSGTYIYKKGQWAKSPIKYYEGSNTPLTSFSNTVIDMGTPGELKTEWKWNISSNNGVEKMPGEIIVKRNKKVGRRLIMV